MAAQKQIQAIPSQENFTVSHIPEKNCVWSIWIPIAKKANLQETQSGIEALLKRHFDKNYRLGFMNNWLFAQLRSDKPDIVKVVGHRVQRLFPEMRLFHQEVTSCLPEKKVPTEIFLKPAETHAFGKGAKTPLAAQSKISTPQDMLNGLKTQNIKTKSNEQQEEDDSLNRRKVYCKIHPTHSKSLLWSYFSEFGELDRLDLKYDYSTKKPRNFGYVTFKKEEDAMKVVEQKNHSLLNKYLICEFSHPLMKQEKTPAVPQHSAKPSLKVPNCQKEPTPLNLSPWDCQPNLGQGFLCPQEQGYFNSTLLFESNQYFEYQPSPQDLDGSVFGRFRKGLDLWSSAAGPEAKPTFGGSTYNPNTVNSSSISNSDGLFESRVPKNRDSKRKPLNKKVQKQATQISTSHSNSFLDSSAQDAQEPKKSGAKVLPNNAVLTASGRLPDFSQKASILAMRHQEQMGNLRFNPPKAGPQVRVCL